MTLRLRLASCRRGNPSSEEEGVQVEKGHYADSSKGLLERLAIVVNGIPRERRSLQHGHVLVCLILTFSLVLLSEVSTVQAHDKQVQIQADLEITYFSNPPDPVVNSPASLFIQVRNTTSGLQLKVFHFVVNLIPPTQTGTRLSKHPLSNSTVFTFNQPGNWYLLFTIGLRNQADFDTTAAFIADVQTGETAGLLAAFANILVTETPRVIPRWGHIFAVVLWLGMMLHVVNTYRLSPSSPTGLLGLARTYRKADIVVALAIGLLILTGLIRAFAHGLTTIPSLFESDFGLVLFTKISLASGMITAGLVNRTVLLGRLERATVPDKPLSTPLLPASKDDAGRTARVMHYLTILEIGLGVSAILFGTIFTQIHTIA